MPDLLPHALEDFRFRALAWGQERTVLVTAEGAGALTVLQTGRSETIPLGGRPHNLAVSPDARRAWVTDASASRVWVVEVSSRKATALPVQGKGPHGLALSPDGRRAVIAHEGDSLLEVFDAERLTPLGRLAPPAPPPNVAVSPDGTTG